MRTNHRIMGLIFLLLLAAWLLLANLAVSQALPEYDVTAPDSLPAVEPMRFSYLPPIQIPAFDGCKCALSVVQEYRDWKIAVGFSTILPGLGNWYAEDEMTFPSAFFMFMEAVLIADIFFDNNFLPKKALPILTVSNHLGAAVSAGIKAKRRVEWLRTVME